jgi:hypothetical protein
MRLTWRKQPNETGLMSVGQGPRGATLHIDGVMAGRVAPRSVGFHRWRGWYWVAGWECPGVEYKNTCDSPVETIDEAKAQCAAYVRAELAMKREK